MQWIICTMLHFVRSVSLDVWRVERYVCFWPLWSSKRTISFTVTTFSSVRVAYTSFCRSHAFWSVLHVSQVSVNNNPTLSLLQSILKKKFCQYSPTTVFFEPVGLQVLSQRFVSTAKWHITSAVYRPYLTLTYLRGGQALTPAQRWGRMSSAQCASLNVTRRLQVTAIKP